MNQKSNFKLTLKDFDGILEALDFTALLSVTDDKGNMIYANDKFVQVSQYSLKEIIGQSILKFFQSPEGGNTALIKTLKTGKSWRGEVKNRAKNGSYYWVDSSIAPILSKKGKPERFLAIHFLITEKKILEMEKSKADEKRYAFISMLSHQLRTPISSARAIVEVLKHDARYGVVHEAYTKIDHLNDIVSTLLYFVERERGNGETKTARKESADLVEIVGAQLDFLKKLADDKKITITKKIPKHAVIAFPKVLLNRVIYGVLHNAITYSKDFGSVDISIKEDPKKYILLVADNGYGIPKNEQKDVFASFFRASNASLGANQGSGLNLYITKQILESFHGLISFESKEDKGSTFSLHFQR
jgi:PAS domain S-box-containing protein